MHESKPHNLSTRLLQCCIEFERADRCSNKLDVDKEAVYSCFLSLTSASQLAAIRRLLPFDKQASTANSSNHGILFKVKRLRKAILAGKKATNVVSCVSLIHVKHSVCRCHVNVDLQPLEASQQINWTPRVASARVRHFPL